jgi:hypothetical protein
MLRWLFFVLLLLNILVFLWGYQRPSAVEAEVPPPLPPDIPRLILLSEDPIHNKPATDTPPSEAATTDSIILGAETAQEGLELPKEPKSAPEQTEQAKNTPKSPEEPMSCIRLGPFERQADAFALIGELNENSLDAAINMQVQQRQTGYWVLAETNGTSAQQLLAQLQSAGISDVWRFTKGQLAGAISLGLYTRLNRATDRLKDVQNKGIAAHIQPRIVEDTTYWIHVAYPQSDLGVVTQLEKISQRYPSLDYPPAACAAIANEAPIP